MQDRSLGLIETIGYTAAVEAVDAACKAARVTFLGHELVDKGLVTVKFAGDVAAVQAAVAAGAAAAQRVGRVISVHVIPRPDGQLGSLGPGFPDLAPNGPAPGPRESSPTAGGLPTGHTDTDTDSSSASEPPHPIESGIEQDKPAENELSLPPKSKSVKAPEDQGQKIRKTGRSRKKPDK